jgi:ABC-type transport system involved in multi-copper enzyme maturation permease subunit
MFALSFLSLVFNETKRTFKGHLSSYFWFMILILISTYSLSAEKYADVSIDRSLMTFKTGNNPMTEILTFVTSFAINSASDVLSGKVPGIVFPTIIGVNFFIIFPMLLGLTMISSFIIKKASTSIAREKEKKTLYILAVSPLTRPEIYLGKFTGIFLVTLPMILFLYATSRWIFSTLFRSSPDISHTVLETSIIITLLFISAGMLISVLARTEKTALSIGTRIVGSAALLTTFWIVIPFIELLLNFTNNNSDFLLLIEKITWFSPFTLELMSVYDPSVATSNFIILIFASFLFLVLGMVSFNRKDIEY